MGKWVVPILVALAVLYFGSTGYAGYLVGKGIDDAKHRSLVTNIGSTLIGRRSTERIALRQANLPSFVTISPTFWMVLRRTE